MPVDLEIVSPEKLLLSRPVDMVVIPAAEGEMGVLPQHAPMIVLLQEGVIRLYEGNRVTESLKVSGGFAEVTLQLATVANGFAVPTQAVVPSARGHGVYLLRDGKAAFQNVEIGMRTAEQVQVLRGLKEGDQVLPTHILRLRPGVPVKPVAP